MQKLVVKLDIHDESSCKQKAIKLVSSIAGIDSISMDSKEKKLTVIGDMDPVVVVKKLRRNYRTEIVSVGPAKEPEKPKDPPKKPEPIPVPVMDFIHAVQARNSCSNTFFVDPYNGYYRSVEEDPNSCVIC